MCERFELDGVVCPPKMRSGLFTVAAVDNLDYNPSATTAKDSFHGTGISLIHSLKCQLSLDTQHLRFIICGTGVIVR